MDSAPSMVQRSGDTLIVRRVVSGEQLVLDQLGNSLAKQQKHHSNNNSLLDLRKDPDNRQSDYKSQHQLPIPLPAAVVAALQLQQQVNSFNSRDNSLNSHLQQQQQHQQQQQQQKEQDDEEQHSSNKSDHGDAHLPQCKIKRNYSCNYCPFFTQNPRRFLTHLRDSHGEKIVINECKFCLYASRHYQKLVRHMKMVHGSTEGINEPAHFRRRLAQNREAKKRKMSTELKQPAAMPSLQAIPNFPTSTKTSASDLSAFNQMLQLQFLNQAAIQYNQEQAAANAAAQDPDEDDLVSMEYSMNMPGNGNKLLKCILCEFQSFAEDKLIEHEKIEHSKTRFFRCEKCSYVTHIKARFSKHVKYHSMPMIKCVLCDFRTPYKWNLDRHMKNHGGNGAFKCSVCNFTADIKQSLTVHEMNHHVPPIASGYDLDRTFEDMGPEGLNIFEMFAISNMQNNEQNLFQNQRDDSSNSKDGDAPPGIKRKKPIPALIPLKVPATSSSSALNLSTNKSDSDANHDSSGAEDYQDSDNMNQYKIISSLLQKPELSVESIYKAGGAGSSNSDNVLALKKKNTSFFDVLRKKLIEGTAVNDDKNLTCKCNYDAKTLSDLIIHQKVCRKTPEKMSSPALGSTRCQYCRHRCKSSQDLAHHLQNCHEAQSVIECLDSSSEHNGDDHKDHDDYMSDEAAIDNPNERHPMENVVFVWNDIGKKEASDSMDDKNDDSDDNNLVISNDDDDLPETPTLTDSEYLGVESAPGYGEITKKIESGDEIMMNTAMKKVFKCPHCSFWASTASRFHVHIVGHLNKKPFECSLCAYRSNWRWDITKHIRLKLLRDPAHGDAKVLMNDETGRRNYSKYNKYVTLMRVVDKKHDGKHTKSGSVMTFSPKSQLVAESNIQSPPSSASTPHSVYSDPMNIASASTASSPHHVNSMLLEQLSKDFNFLKNFPHFNTQPFNLQQMVAHALNQSQQAQMMPSGSGGEMEHEKQAKDAENSKKTHFKCKKCNFKHADRDVVLEHVKSHYRDDGQPLQQQPESLAPPPPPIQMPFTINAAINNFLNGTTNTGTTISSTSSSSSTATNNNNTNHITLGVGAGNGGGTINTSQSQSKLITHTLLPQSTLNFNSHAIINTNNLINSTNNNKINNNNSNNITIQALQQSSVTPSSSHDGSSKHINGMMMTDSNSASSVKGSFRCGHCGQISNWKHVIQRHCRLKHNGDILIEVNGTKSDKHATKIHHHHPYIMPQQQQKLLENVQDNAFKPIILSQRLVMSPPSTSDYVKNQQLLSPPSSSNDNYLQLDKEISLASMLKVELGEEQDKVETEIPATSIYNPHNAPQMSTPEPTTSGLKNTKRYQCESCPYETDSKSQFLHHKTFHSKTQSQSYQCKYCSYNVSKRHLLNQHMKMHTNASRGDDDNRPASPVSSHVLDEGIPDKHMHFCSQCPAHYLSLKEIKFHQKMHENSAHTPYRCDFCSFSSQDESHVKAHGAVHTAYYQEKTKEFMAKYKVVVGFPKPELFVVKQCGDGEDVWIVKEPNEPLEDEEEEEEPEQNEQRNDERCPYCPLMSTSLEQLKDHLQNHFVISGRHRRFKCEHCDYSSDHDERTKTHVKLHFSCLYENSRNIDLFTSFLGLELNITKIPNNNPANNSNDSNNNALSSDGDNLIYKENDVDYDDRSESDGEQSEEKVVIDV